MSFTNGTKSILLFVFSMIALLFLTLFESALSSLSVSTEHIISFVLLVLPSLAGLGFGVFGLIIKRTPEMDLHYRDFIERSIRSIHHLCIVICWTARHTSFV